MCFALFSFLHHFLQLGDILLKLLYLLLVVGGYGYMSGSRTYNAMLSLLCQRPVLSGLAKAWASASIEGNRLSAPASSST